MNLMGRNFLHQMRYSSVAIEDDFNNASSIYIFLVAVTHAEKGFLSKHTQSCFNSIFAV